MNPLFPFIMRHVNTSKKVHIFKEIIFNSTGENFSKVDLNDI